MLNCTYSISIFFSLFWVLCKVRLMSSFILSASRHLWWRASIFLNSGSALPSLYTSNKNTTGSIETIVASAHSYNHVTKHYQNSGASFSSYFLAVSLILSQIPSPAPPLRLFSPAETSQSETLYLHTPGERWKERIVSEREKTCE